MSDYKFIVTITENGRAIAEFRGDSYSLDSLAGVSVLRVPFNARTHKEVALMGALTVALKEWRARLNPSHHSLMGQLESAERITKYEELLK